MVWGVIFGAKGEKGALDLRKWRKKVDDYMVETTGAEACSIMPCSPTNILLSGGLKVLLIGWFLTCIIKRAL